VLPREHDIACPRAHAADLHSGDALHVLGEDTEGRGVGRALLEHLDQLLDRHRSAATQAPDAHLHPVQLRNQGDVDKRRPRLVAAWRIVVLCDAVRCVRANRLQSFARSLRYNGHVLVQRCRPVPLLLPRLVDVMQGLDDMRQQRWRMPDALVLATALAALGKGTKRCEDGPVAGTPAQVAIEVLLDLLGRWGAVLLEKGVHVHHPARRAVAALGAVALRDRGLHLVEAVALTSHAFGGHNVAAIDGAEPAQATVDWYQLDPPRLEVLARHGNGADAAAAFAAALVCPGHPLVLPQPIQKDEGWRGIRHDHLLAIKPEGQLTAPINAASSIRILAARRLRAQRTDHLPVVVPLRLHVRLSNNFDVRNA